ncbi:ornithine cyclodeaminase family protein [Corynebacterium sp. UBA2622]|uniref:ornithine cyclodeaminase family protein n=1 Tax=Corynebacterium sp. UBA2622 TaxID=1946393 RepID=UPI0025BA6FF1|nr:ornithine cyclodeaminase family protein [Corynebacterium sp. UBA2622]
MEIITHDEVMSRLSPAEAVDALRDALAAGFDPESDLPRTKVPLAHGEMHLMPSTLPHVSGVKILAIQPADHDPLLPLIQGQYLLFDGPTLTPTTLIDGAALTTLRTPAVSLAGVKDALAGGNGPLTAVIVGTGTQGCGHAAALESVFRSVRPVEITFVGRSEPEGLGYPWAAAGSPEATEAVAAAELVVCATTSLEPVVDLQDVRRDSVVVAVGSHTTDAREIGSDLMGAAHVIVEDGEVALREAGDVTLAIADGALQVEDLIPVRDVVTGTVSLTRDRPVVFKTVGMPWEDLVVADAVRRAGEV